MDNYVSASSDRMMENASPFASGTVYKPEINDPLRSVDGPVPVGMSPYTADRNLNEDAGSNGIRRGNYHIGFYCNPSDPLMGEAATSQQSYSPKAIGFESYASDTRRVLYERPPLNNPGIDPFQKMAMTAPESNESEGFSVHCLMVLVIVLICLVIFVSVPRRKTSA